jgi:peptidoglycan/LPS O-acetylase OafA/YrhL
VLLGIAAGHYIRGVDVQPGDLRTIFARDFDLAEVDAAGAGGGHDMLDPGGFQFAHLWFLWFLVLFIAGFWLVVVVASWLAARLGRWRPLAPWVRGASLLALPCLSLVAQMNMTDPVFGPDTSQALLPSGVVLAYYACFFSFGALAYDHRMSTGGLMTTWIGRRYALQLAFALGVLYPLGRWIGEGLAFSIIQVAYAWIVCFGLIGLFRRFVGSEDRRVRWLSDASYWVYLIHLPMVCVAEGVVARLPLPTVVDFALIVTTVAALALLTYQYLVRYGWIGTLLNGKRMRDPVGRRPSVASLAGSTS